MAATTVHQHTHSASWVRGGAAGLIAGLVFAMWAMLVGIFTPDSNLWAPPQGIAQSLGIGSSGHTFQFVPFVIGLMGHMMNSVIFGLIFVAIVAATRLKGSALIVGGMMYGLVVYAAMYWVVLRGLLAGNSGSFLSANPEWSWVLAHLMFGLVLAALLLKGPLAAHRHEA